VLTNFNTHGQTEGQSENTMPSAVNRRRRHTKLAKTTANAKTINSNYSYICSAHTSVLSEMSM